MKRLTLQSFIILLLQFWMVSACNKLSTEQKAAPVIFKGVRELDTNSKGVAILLWDRPRGGIVAGFQVFVQDLSVLSTTETQAALALDEGGATSSSPIILTNIGDEGAPVKLGKLIQIVEADKTSFEIPYLLPGRYAIQVKAVGGDGALDVNTRVAILRVDSALGYSGIESAEIEGDEIVLKWPMLETTLTSRNVIYTVYEGSTFENARAITDQLSFRLSLLGYREGSTHYFGVRSTDASGRTDRNIKTISVTMPASSGSFQGCISGEAQGADRILLKFEWPTEELDMLKIYRDGNLVYSSRDRGVTEFLDLGLNEGEHYKYSCLATHGDRVLVGKKILSLSTLSSNPPSFRGITGVEMKTAHSALVKWGVSSGVPTETFWIYANPGLTVDWSLDPIAKASLEKLEYLVEGLGDELTYSFGVRACSSKGICDTNEALLQGATADDGAPKTGGASGLHIADGKLHITAPWSHADGGLSKRLLYIKENGATPTGVSGMTLVTTLPVPDKSRPDTVLTYGPIGDNTNYHALVIDQDSAGQKSSGGTVRSLFSGDTTKPLFNGQTALLVGPSGSEETSLQAKFMAIASEPGSVIGASFYDAYVATGGANACQSTTIHQSFPATNFTAGSEGTITITGLSALTLYSVCVKARDAAGNSSINSIATSRSTLDKTAPAFDGIQSLTYSKTSGQLLLGWNPSNASDLYEYSIKLWKGSANPTSVPNVIIKKRSNEVPTGIGIGSATFAIASEEVIYALVSACDNAGSVAGGTQNCSNHLASTAKVLTLDDIDPPPGFLGIESESNLGATVEGQITVRWIAPNDWNDYRGFAVYFIDSETGDLDLAKDCPCTADNCPNMLTQCVIENLVPYQTYKFHVRAYDDAGNYTILDPDSSSTSKRVLDVTPPTFASALQLSFADAKVNLSWSQASDNQSTSEPGVDIYFEVYRKRAATFDNATNPAADGQAALMTRTAQSSATSWADIGSDFISGQTYYYTVCAVDASNNRRCDGNVKSHVIPDLVPPEITSFTSNKTDADYEWDITWVASDLVTSGANLLYKVYSKQSDLATDVATTSDNLVFIQTGNSTYADVRGPMNKDTYLHYLLVVEDADGNRATKTLTIYSQNKMTLTSVRSTEGLTTGGNLLVLIGDGFKPNIQVKIGESDCVSVVRYSNKHVLCRAPSGTAGLYNVRVLNADGSSATLANAYSYCSGAGCQNICNRPGSWGVQFASGAGTDASPYVICNATHLNAMRNIDFGKSYRLGENIDLQGVAMDPLHNTGSTKEFRGKFEGDNFVISNWTYNNINADIIGLFGVINLSVVRNLGLINFDVTGKNYVGALAGGVAITVADPANGYFSQNATVSGIFATGTVAGSGQRIGGIIGHSGGLVSNLLGFMNVSGAQQVGGLIGRKFDGGADMEHHGTVTATGSAGECRVGGISGTWTANSFSIINMKNYGSVTCTDQANVSSSRTGGISGALFTATVENLVNYASVTGKNWVGGIFGAADLSTITNLTNYGNVSGHWVVGGLTGQTYQIVSLISGTNNGTVSATSTDVGGISGRLYGTSGSRVVFSNLTNNGSVTTTSTNVGGLIGFSEFVTMADSVNNGAVTGTGTSGGAVGTVTGTDMTNITSRGHIRSTSGTLTGGLVGTSWGANGRNVIKQSQVTGTIDGRDYTGGLVGLLYGSISESSFDGDITGLGRVGGLVGQIESGTAGLRYYVEKSWFEGTLTGDNICGGVVGELKDYNDLSQTKSNAEINCVSSVGGAIGSINGDNIVVEKSSTRGSVYGNTPVGGFLGAAFKTSANNVIIRDSYSRAQVRGNDSVGGFAGTSGAIFTRVYSSGKVSFVSTNSRLGGLVGQLHGAGTVSDSFWDLTSSTQATSALGDGKITSLMLGSATYANFDQAIWSFSATDYPQLIWETTP